MADPEFVEQRDPEEVFSLLADDTRVEILRELWNVEKEVQVLSFSALHDAVDIKDSGQFNYHLNKLVGPLVTKTEDGYQLTQAGEQINGAIAAGAYTVEANIEPMSLEESCQTCGGTRTLHYEDERVRVECEQCPIKSHFGVPPSVFMDCDREQIPDVASQYLRTMFRHIHNGFCWNCEGRVDGKLEPIVTSPDEEIPELRGDAAEEIVDQIVDIAAVRYSCTQCGSKFTAGPRMTFAAHPEVSKLYYEHGMAIADCSFWRFAALDPDQEYITSRDPLRVAVVYEAGDEQLTLEVNEELEVVETGWADRKTDR